MNLKQGTQVDTKKTDVVKDERWMDGRRFEACCAHVARRHSMAMVDIHAHSTRTHMYSMYAIYTSLMSLGLAPRASVPFT